MPKRYHPGRIHLLSLDAIDEIDAAARTVLETTGVKVYNAEALRLLKEAGCALDGQLAHIPRGLVAEALRSAPRKITIHSEDGKQDLRLEGDRVHFNPGSTALNVVDRHTGEMRLARSRDLIEFARVVDACAHIHAQSTAMVVSDVPTRLQDRYRLYLLLKTSPKAIVTGAFTTDGVPEMARLLNAVHGDEQQLAKRPLAIFDVCPSPPLKWSEATCQHLIDCARLGIPSEIVVMPQFGLSAPVTLAGSLVQAHAEFLSALVIAQLAKKGAPVIYGGSPNVFDMRHGTIRLGAIEVAMVGAGLAQIAKRLKFPTHMYLGLSDAKVPDAQAGAEAMLGLLVGAAAGINNIAGPGMLSAENCQSFEKLVIDDELCAAALRFADGIRVDPETLAVEAIQQVGAGGNFLSARHTLEWFRSEILFPSEIIDRLSYEAWEAKGRKDVVHRARDRIEALLREPLVPPREPDLLRALDGAMAGLQEAEGAAALPEGPSA